MTWDIFCTVIDNYGDIGVTWRLARQLAVEHAIPVRLWVDDLAAFRCLQPEIDPMQPVQYLSGVEIRPWRLASEGQIEPAEVVIEALACRLPEAFLLRMAARQPPPLWLNLDYLSAEDWVAGVHRLPSPHPRLPLTQYFFMPGYQAQTGGLTRERDLVATRQAFQADHTARIRFFSQLGVCQKLGLPPATDATLFISLFCYENLAMAALLQAWSQSLQPICVLLPVGKALPQVADWFGATTAVPGTRWQRAALTVVVLPMLSLDAYDRLLWACDLNFVRGEDSCVRAQWAARPMVWQAYRQEEGAHWPKLNALLDLYCATADAAVSDCTRAFWLAWNQESAAAVTAHWPAMQRTLPTLHVHARNWATKLAAQTDLATNLLNFCCK